MIHFQHGCLCWFPSQFAADLRVGARAGFRWEPAVEGGVQNVVQVPGHHKVQVGLDVGRQLLQVFLVPLREDDPLHASSVRRQDLILDPAHLMERKNKTICTKQTPDELF